MTVEITDDATPTIVGKRIGAIGLQVVCPYCRQTMGWKRGQPKHHTHGTGGKPGPRHRLAHCADADLPKHLLERQRSGQWLSYEIIELSEPRRVTGPQLVPNGQGRDAGV